MHRIGPLSPVIPVFLLIAIGFFFARWKKISLVPVTEIIVYLGAPCLVFTSLTTRPILGADIAVILLGALGIIAGVGLLIRLYSLVFHFSSRGFALPLLFMNAGNMGIPLALFAFGEAGLQRASLFFVIMSTLHYSLGIYVLSGKGSWKEIFRLPLIYATVFGLLVNLAGLSVPDPVFKALWLLGYSTIPLMLISLGYRLQSIQSVMWAHSVGGALIRIVGGFASAYGTVTLLGIHGINRQVILLYGCLPSAVVNFVLTEKYGQDPELAASIILLTTLFSFATVPLVFWFIL
ncbi:MAG: AEC family transporter [Candidatus Binatia bacterium]